MVDGVRKHAIVRGVAGTFDSCIKPHGEPQVADPLLGRVDAGVEHRPGPRLEVELLALGEDLARHLGAVVVELGATKP